MEEQETDRINEWLPWQPWRKLSDVAWCVAGSSVDPCLEHVAGEHVEPQNSGQQSGAEEHRKERDGSRLISVLTSDPYNQFSVS